MTTPLEPIAWIALVARWTELARASRAIPPSDTRLRDSIAHLIAIEATTAALGELAQVPEAERPHARTIAEMTIRRAATELDQLWRGEEWPNEFLDACEAAERALRVSIYAGLETLVVGGTEPIEVPAFDLRLAPDATNEAASPRSQQGSLAVMPPGTIAMPGEPVCWWCGREAPVMIELDTTAAETQQTKPPELFLQRNLAPLQVYRELDDRGCFVKDTVAPITDDLLAGLPLLVPILLDGVSIGRFLHTRTDWLAMQRAALAGRLAIPVDGSLTAG
jgi:hypothetical protein